MLLNLSLVRPSRWLEQGYEGYATDAHDYLSLERVHTTITTFSDPLQVLKGDGYRSEERQYHSAELERTRKGCQRSVKLTLRLFHRWRLICKAHSRFRLSLESSSITAADPPLLISKYHIGLFRAHFNGHDQESSIVGTRKPQECYQVLHANYLRQRS